MMETDQAARARRHATVGALARPAQHEINNLLTVVFANLELLRRGAAEGAPRRQLDRVGEAAKRFEASTRALLSLARRPVDDTTPFAPAAVVEALRPLLTLLVPAPGALVIALTTTAAVTGDRAAFEDALLACAAGLPTDGRLALDCSATATAVEIRLGFSAPPPPAVVAALAPLAPRVVTDQTVVITLPVAPP